MLKKRGRARHHLTVAVVISLLSVLYVSSAESRAQTPPAPVLTEQEAVAIAKTANRQTKKDLLDIDGAAKSIWEAKDRLLSAKQGAFDRSTQHHLVEPFY